MFQINNGTIAIGRYVAMLYGLILESAFSVWVETNDCCQLEREVSEMGS